MSIGRPDGSPLPPTYILELRNLAALLLCQGGEKEFDAIALRTTTAFVTSGAFMATIGKPGLQ